MARLTEMLSFRCCGDERGDYEAAALREGLTVGAWIRRVLNEEVDHLAAKIARGDE